MSDVKISALPVAATLTGSELVPIVQSSVTSQTTTQDIANLAPTPSGGITTVKVSLTSAQILTLQSVAHLLVSAPGAGKIINVISIQANLIFGTIAYTTNTNLQFSLGNGAWSLATINGVLGNSSNQIYTYNFIGANGNPSSIVNTAMKVICPTGNPAAGDGTLDIYISYTVITL